MLVSWFIWGSFRAPLVSYYVFMIDMHMQQTALLMPFVLGGSVASVLDG